MDDIRKFENGIKIEPKTSTEADSKGELEVISGTGKLQYHNGSSVSPVVTANHAETLTQKTLTTPVINSPTGIVKGDVGLGNVDNTSDATKNAASVALTNHTIDADLNTLSNIKNADIKAAAGIALNKLAATTVSKVLISDGSGFISASTVTPTTLAFLDATSSVQTQIDAKAAGAASSTDNAVARFDSTTGKIIQNSGVIVSDANAVTGVTALDVDNIKVDGNTISSTDTNGNIILDPNGTGEIRAESLIRIPEIATPGTPASGYGYTYFKTDGALYYKNDAAAEVKLQAGSGGINYILNSDFEGGTTGWGTYKNAVAAVIPDGTTTGTADISFTATAISPRRGTYSGMIDKGAANRQGQGIYYDFTIDPADKSKNLSLTFDYASSALYTGSAGTEYLVVYIWDVTNSTLIPTSNINVPQGTGFQTITWNSTTSTSYRLFFHIAGTGSSLWTYQIDTVTVGPQDVIMSAAISDLSSIYTFTPNNFGTVTNNVIKSGRDGDKMPIQGSFTLGASPAGSTASLSLPTGITIDSSKYGATRTIVGWLVNETSSSNSIQGGNNNFGAIFYDGSDTAKLYFACSTNASSLVKSNGNAFISSQIFHINIPGLAIANWSSNIQLSNSRVEYASNSGTTDASDSTSFINDPNGSLVPQATLTLVRSKRIRFKNPVQASDTIVVQVQVNGSGPWIDFNAPVVATATSICPFQLQNGIGYGFGGIIPVSPFTTDLDVRFGQYSMNTGGTYGAAGDNFGNTHTTKWRVLKYSNAVPVESAAQEHKESKSSGSVAFAASGQYKDLTSLILTPGEWDLTLVGIMSATASVTDLRYGISTTTGNSTTGLVAGDNLFFDYPGTASFNKTFIVPSYRVLVTTTTTYYAKIQASFGGSTPNVDAHRFSARRQG